MKLSNVHIENTFHMEFNTYLLILLESVTQTSNYNVIGIRLRLPRCFELKLPFM